jgi:hypothetical protein
LRIQLNSNLPHLLRHLLFQRRELGGHFVTEVLENDRLQMPHPLLRVLRVLGFEVWGREDVLNISSLASQSSLNRYFNLK